MIWVWPSSTLTHEEARKINGVGESCIVGNVLVPHSRDRVAIVIHRKKRSKEIEARLSMILGRTVKNMVRQS